MTASGRKQPQVDHGVTVFYKTRIAGWILVAIAILALLPGGERFVTGDGSRSPFTRKYPLNIVPPGAPYEIRVIYAILLGAAGVALLSISKRR